MPRGTHPNSLKNLTPGSPGRGTGGRKLCVETLDKMLQAEGNQKLLYEKLQEMFFKDPLAFLLKFVYPILPKDINLELRGNRENPIELFLVTFDKLTKDEQLEYFKSAFRNSKASSNRKD